MILPGLILANMFYLAAFDHLPNSLRLGIAAVLGAGYIAAGLYGIATRPTFGLGLMFAGFCLMLLAWGFGPFVDPFEPMRSLATPDAGIRKAVTFMAGIAILSRAQRLPHQGILIAISVMIALAAFAALTNPLVSLSDEPELRLAPFTGAPFSDEPSEAPDGLHSSAYVLSLCLLIVYSMVQTNVITKSRGGALMAIMMLLILGYQVRTAWMLLIAFSITTAAAWLARQGRDGTAVVFTALFGLISLAALALFAMSVLDVGLDIKEVSSGRTGTYAERLEFFKSRPLVSLILGSGPGSDLMYSRTWWWTMTDSHNDFLTMMVEGGIVALLGTFIYLIGIAVHCGRNALPFVAGIFVSSALSNALINRPMIVTLMFVAIAFKCHKSMQTTRVLTLRRVPRLA